MDNSIFVRVKETCKKTGLSQGYIRKRIAAGTCPYIRSGNRFLINYPAFIAILEREALEAVKERQGNNAEF